MKYTREILEKGYNFHNLKAICIELGGIPSNKNKDGLIDLILSIQDGTYEPKRKHQGRKSNFEKYKEQKIKEYQDDTFNDSLVSDVSSALTGVETVIGQSIRVGGTFEKSEGYEHGFLRGSNFKRSNVTDVYVSANAVRSFKLRNGDFVEGVAVYGRDNNAPSLTTVSTINGISLENLSKQKFSDLEPCYPNEQIVFARGEVKGDIALREIDLLAPIGRGQRALIVAPPKTGKTTLIKKIASSINANYNDIYLMVLLIGERPEEVTDIKRSVNAELIYSTFDERAKDHVRISELAIEKAKRMVEQGKHVVILMDSITKLVRAYNETVQSSGKTLTGGIDPSALQEAKKVFGSARNIDGGGSLTMIATVLTETGSKMEEVIYEEFKGTGNSEIVLLRSLSERRIFPSIDVYRSGTRKDELLLSDDALNCAYSVRRMLDANKDAEVKLIELLKQTETNEEFIEKVAQMSK